MIPEKAVDYGLVPLSYDTSRAHLRLGMLLPVHGMGGFVVERAVNLFLN